MSSSARNVSAIIMAIAYSAAGINHFVHPGTYMAIMPPWLPFRAALVFISGVCELLFGLLLLPRPSRSVAARLIMLLLVAVFPANVQMAVNFYHQHHPYLWLALLRLPLQAVLIWWAYTLVKDK